MSSNTKKIENYDEFKSYISNVISSVRNSVEQVIQFDSKYFKADINLFKYNVDLLSNISNSENITKKLYIVLRSKDDIQKSIFKEYIKPYKINGFDVKNVFLCDMKTDNNINLDDLILIDNSLCITAETNEYKKSKIQDNEITTYHINSINSNETKIKKARNLLQRLRHETFRQRNTSKIFEPLSESADINFRLAIENCQNGIMSSGDCKWYHSVWQYLRVIDKVSSPEWHATFYDNCFNKLISKKDNPRILISGTADYSLLAYVHNSIKKSNQNAEIFVLDTCNTPLKICEWYAKKQNFQIKLLNMNILDLSNLKLKFDLICSDAFLTRFSKTDAESVVSNWYHSLNYNGMIVTTIRCRNNNTTADDEFQKKNYVKDCVERFQKWEGYFDISLENFEDMAKEYVNKMTSHNLGNKQSIIKMFKNSGFVLEDLTSMSDTPGELGETTYCEICCSKKEK